jgi:hypothetical protein
MRCSPERGESEIVKRPPESLMRSMGAFVFPVRYVRSDKLIARNEMIKAFTIIMLCIVFSLLMFSCGGDTTQNKVETGKLQPVEVFIQGVGLEIQRVAFNSDASWIVDFVCYGHRRKKIVNTSKGTFPGVITIAVVF